MDRFEIRLKWLHRVEHAFRRAVEVPSPQGPALAAAARLQLPQALKRISECGRDMHA